MITEGSKDHPVQLDPFQLITNVHWNIALPVVLVTLSQGAASIGFQILNQDTVSFLKGPENGESVTYNGVKIVAGTDFVGNTPGLAAADFAAFLNKSPKPVKEIDSAHTFGDGTIVSLRINDTVRTEFTGSSMVVIGESFTEFPPLDNGTVIDTDKYGKFCLYDPFGTAGLYVVDSELIYKVYNYKLHIYPPEAVITSLYGNRVRRAGIFNLNLCRQGQVIVEGRVGTAFAYISIGVPEDPVYVIVREWFSSPAIVTFTGYPYGTRFRKNTDGTLAVLDGAKQLWTFNKTADPDTLVNPYVTWTFDKNGEVIGV